MRRLLFLAAVAVLFGCGGGGGAENFEVSYGEGEVVDFVRGAIGEGTATKAALAELDATLAQPAGVAVHFELNPSGPGSHDGTRVTMNAGFFADPGTDLAVDEVDPLAPWFVLHELGHVLVGVLQLPTPEGEETAADAFTAWVLRRLGEEGRSIAEVGRRYFERARPGFESDLGPRLYFRAHRLTLERSRRLSCPYKAAEPADCPIAVLAGEIGAALEPYSK